MNTPLISVVVPLYNKVQCIEATINSVLEQSFDSFELIIVDDGSTDGSAVLVKSINDNRIRYIYKDNGGVSSARNCGIKEAQGEWVLFLDADDILLPNCLSKLYSVVLSCNQHLDIIAGNYYKVIGRERKLYNKGRYRGVVPNNFKWYFFNKFSIRTGCALIQRKVLCQYPFDESLSRYEDLELILRILKSTVVYTIPDVVFEYCCDNNALSKANIENRFKDFTFLMNFQNKTFWECCKLGELLFLASYAYPQSTLELKKKYGLFYSYRYVSNIIKKLYKLYLLLI